MDDDRPSSSADRSREKDEGARPTFDAFMHACIHAFIHWAKRTRRYDETTPHKKTNEPVVISSEHRIVLNPHVSLYVCVCTSLSKEKTRTRGREGHHRRVTIGDRKGNLDGLDDRAGDAKRRDEMG